MSGLPPASLLLSSSDGDSMAVLDALLRLKEQQEKQQAQGVSAASSLPSPGMPFQTTNFDSSLPRTHQQSPGISSSFAANLGIHPSFLGLLSTMDLSQNQFLASQLAAVAQSGSATTRPFMPSSPMASLSQQVQAMQRAAANLPTINGNGSNTSISLPTEPSSETPAVSNQQASASSPSPLSAKTKPSSLRAVAAEEEIPATEMSSIPATVRKEKVEAALKSRPQRGKRRDDLSEKERMELTRTRNREHAKSTRLRKKARYQELLDSEEQLKSYQEVDILRNEQRTCIRKFLAMREVMLNGVGGESSSTTIAVPSELPQMVEDAGTFSFEFHGHKPLATNVSSVSLQHASDHHQSMLLRMQRWDRDIHKRFISANENYTCTSSASTFHYKIVGGPNGVAISENGLGFAHVELELKPDKDAADESASKLVLTGILTVQFAPSSSRLSSAVWTTTQYVPSFSVDFSRSNAAAGVEAAEAAAPPRDDPSSSSNDSTLENQMNHPSVVSLEIKVSPTDTAESQSPGPGMSI